MAKLTHEQESKILALYRKGNSIRIVKSKTGHCDATIVKVLKKHGASRSVSEAILLGRKNGTIITSEETRQKLSDNAKKAIRQQGKIWTKPEQAFKKILNEMGIGVKFPEYVKEFFSIEDDANPTVCFQYPIQRYVCDFVDVEKRIVFRVNGDFWHANPLLYATDSLTEIQRHNVTQDKNCAIFLNKHGWQICDAWESEIYWNQDLVKDRVRAARKMANPLALHARNTGFDSQVAHSDWSEELKKLWFKKPRRKKVTAWQICLECKNKFKISKGNKRQKQRKYCGRECFYRANRKVQRPSKKELEQEMKRNNWLSLGRKYGVSDNAVRKWARREGLI